MHQAVHDWIVFLVVQDPTKCQIKLYFMCKLIPV